MLVFHMLEATFRARGEKAYCMPRDNKNNKPFKLHTPRPATNEDIFPNEIKPPRNVEVRDRRQMKGGE